jgi:hypothetical protein
MNPLYDNKARRPSTDSSPVMAIGGQRSGQKLIADSIVLR